MDDRWPYPISLTMQRHSGSAPKPRAITSPPVAPAVEPEATAGGPVPAPSVHPAEKP